MKFLVLFITTIISFSGLGQNTSLSDSLKDIPLNKMLAFFRNLELQHLSTKEMGELQFAEIKSFIKKNPANPYSAQFISWGKYFDSSKIDSLYNLLDISLQPSIKESIKYQKIRAALQPGMVFPALVLTDTLNQQVNIAGLRGKTVFIDVWASWCLPCREEMPRLIKLFKQYKDSGFIVIAISLDDDKTKWLNAVIKDQQPWQQFSELKTWRNNSMLNRWGITGIPYNFLIDKKGNLSDKGIDLDFLEKKLRQLL